MDELISVRDTVESQLEKLGYRPANETDCDIFEKGYHIGQNIDLYIDDTHKFQRVSDLKVQQIDEQQMLSYRLNSVEQSLELHPNESVCRIFQRIAEPNMHNVNDFRSNLSMWRKNKWFSQDPIALVYHVPLSVVSGSIGVQDVPGSAQTEGNKDQKKTKYLGVGFAAVMVLSVLGLSLAFYLKNKKQRRLEEEELSRPD
jgi:phosphotransferase system  glucose/maltose/N-acetylglucosamine-specific IIC component